MQGETDPGVRGEGMPHPESDPDQLEETEDLFAAVVLVLPLFGSPPDHLDHQGTRPWQHRQRLGQSHRTSAPCRRRQLPAWRSHWRPCWLLLGHRS